MRDVIARKSRNPTAENSRLERSERSRFKSEISRPPQSFGGLEMTFVRWLLVGLASVFLFPRPVFAAFNLKLITTSFNTHFNPPGEPVTFQVTLRNNETTTQFAEVDISITELSTGLERTLVPVLTVSLPAGGQTTLSQNYPTAFQRAPLGAAGLISPGMYTVAFTMFDGNGAKTDQIRGKFPLHVGSETEDLRVFPEAINLGTLPAGRHLYPPPIEVRWSFFRFNRLRQDQPFSIRIYTDNATRYEGIPHSLRKVSPAGLVSLNGRYVIPVKCWSLNFGPDVQESGWDGTLAGPPPVDDDDLWLGPPLLEGKRNLDSAMWVRIPDLVDMTPNPITWRRLIGQDQYDNRFASDANSTGDFTLRSPFSLYLATEAGPTSVEGSYATTLVVELWSP